MSARRVQGAAVRVSALVSSLFRCVGVALGSDGGAIPIQRRLGKIQQTVFGSAPELKHIPTNSLGRNAESLGKAWCMIADKVWIISRLQGHLESFKIVSCGCVSRDRTYLLVPCVQQLLYIIRTKPTLHSGNCILDHFGTLGRV